MISEIIKNDGIIALIGVVIGFALSEISSIYKKYKDRVDCKDAIYDEIRFNHKQTIDKIDILNKAIAALKDKKFLPTKCAKYSTIEFENMYHVAIKNLTTIEKDNFRHLISFYVTIDKMLDGFDESFKNDLDNTSNRKNTLDSVYDAAIIQLSDIKQSLSNSLQLSLHLLENKPLQIFRDE